MANKHFKVKAKLSKTKTGKSKTGKIKLLRLPNKNKKSQYNFLKNLQKKVSNTINKLKQTLQLRKSKTLKR